MDSSDVRNIRPYASICEATTLSDAVTLKCWSEISKGIVAWIVVERVLSDESTKRPDGFRTYEVNKGRRNVKAPDFAALVLRSHWPTRGAESAT